jgi:hypothetical protein
VPAWIRVADAEPSGMITVAASCEPLLAGNTAMVACSE